MKRQTFDLSRRKILAGIGSIGIASAGAGLGTSAYFSDEETYENNQLVAGELDMYVAFEEHYSDWSDDEAEGLEGDVVMEDGTDLSDESRVGLPSNAAPMISVRDAADANQFLDNTLDTAYPEGYDAGTELDDPCGDESPLQDGTERHPAAIDLDDVKPGDFGEVTFSFALCDNPGYVWATGGLVSKDENGLTEPERKDPDEEEGVVELLDVVRAAVWVDDGNNFQNGAEAPVLAGSLRDVLHKLAAGTGTRVHPVESEGRVCFDAETVHNVVFAWWVPVDHENEIQTDSVTFDLGFYTEQCRHNDGADLSTDLVAYYPFESVGDGIADDYSSTGNDGAVQDGVSSGSGQLGMAAAFDGTTDLIEVPDDGSLDITGPYTETAWVYPTATGGKNDITMKDPGQWALGFQVFNGQLRAGFEDESDTNFIGIDGSVPTNAWTHLAVVYTGEAVKGYVNGAQVFDLTSASDSSTVAVSDATPATNDQPLTIGGGVDYFEGRIDELRIYNRVLDEYEIQRLANQ